MRNPMDPNRRTKRNLLLAVLTLAGTTLFGGAFGPRLFALSDASNPALKEYADLLATTKAWYADDLASDKLVYASVHGMLGSLDPHTNFLEPEEYGAMQEKQRGSFFGLGIIISKRNGKVTVITPVEGSPAERLGIRAGDVIDRIEGESIDDLAVDAVVKKLKGPKGTKVRITIVRPGLVEPLEMTVTRAEIPTNSVAFAFMLDEETAYVRLKDFTQTTVPEMLETWTKMEKSGMKRLVLDLRGNPGGLLDQAIGLSDFFVRKGEKVVFTRGRNASSEQVFNAPGRNSKPRIPVVVLINKGSASAAEIVAGAIQDHDRGLIVGQTSWGKGLVQSVYTLTDGAGLALTTAKYYTPSGRCIQRDYREVIEYLIPGEEDLESDEAETAPDKKSVFRTDSGRTVYGGGGITPDVSVKIAPLSRFAAGLFARGVFFEFAVDYRTQHPSIPRGFQVTDEVRADFFKFVDSRPSAPFDKPARELYAAEKDSGVIDRSIREELMNTIYGRETGYRVQLEGDPQLKAARGLFAETAKLAGITGAEAARDATVARK